MMVPPHCLKAWRIVARHARPLLAILLAIVLAIAGASLAITGGVLLLALAAAVYAEILQAIRSAE